MLHLKSFEDITKMNKLAVGDHSVLLYENESETIEPIISYIKSSLKRGEKCIYIEGDADTDLLIKKLKSETDNFDKLIKDKKLQFLSADETYALSDQFEADKMIKYLKELSCLAIKDGYSGISITGELSWVLNFKGSKEEIIKYEWMLNDEVFNRYPVVALCRYNLNKFDNEIIRSIIELHQFIIWKNKIHENPYYIEPDKYKNNSILE